MSIFDEKAYDYLTQPDNWPIAKEIKDKMIDVESRLLNEFWDDVKKGIKGKLGSKEWEVKISEDIYDAYSNISISHLMWENLFLIVYEELEEKTYIGVWCDLDLKKVPDALFRQIGGKLLEKDNRMVSNWGNSYGYTCYFYTGDDFRQTQTLNRILPSNRKTIVDKYTSEFIGLLEKAKPIIDEAMKQLK